MEVIDVTNSVRTSWHNQIFFKNQTREEENNFSSTKA